MSTHTFGWGILVGSEVCVGQESCAPRFSQDDPYHTLCNEASRVHLHLFMRSLCLRMYENVKYIFGLSFVIRPSVNVVGVRSRRNVLKRILIRFILIFTQLVISWSGFICRATTRRNTMRHPLNKLVDTSRGQVTNGLY